MNRGQVAFDIKAPAIYSKLAVHISAHRIAPYTSHSQARVDNSGACSLSQRYKMKGILRHPSVIFSALALLLVLLISSCSSSPPELSADELETEATGSTLAVKVKGTSSGLSTKYIGANGTELEYSRDFKINDVKALGITTYRLWSGMEKLEPVDDDGVYGSPSIAQMKQSGSRVNLVNWSAFDARMKDHGDILKQLHTVPGMQPMMILRNSGWWGNFWVPKMNVTGSSCTAPNGSNIVWPKFTQDDWNEWWQHVFAVVYWVNVRNGNSMRVDHWGVHNEPNHAPQQGWCGTKAQYLEFVKYTNDAIDFVYKTYLNNRPRSVIGGTTSGRKGWQDWIRPLLKNSTGYQPSMFNALAVNAFGAGMGKRVATTRNLTLASGTASYVRNYPIWVTEMGGYKATPYANIRTVVDHLVNSLIAGSTPGKTRAEGAVMYRLFDGTHGVRTNGLVKSDGTRRPGFYAFRLAVMALNGGKQVFPTQFSNSSVKAITTRESSSSYNLLMTNKSSKTTFPVRADVAELLKSGKAELYLFSGSRSGSQSLQPFSSFNFSNGRLQFNLPPRSVVLVRFRS